MNWWLFAAYAVVITALSAYGLWLRLCARRLVAEELELRQRLGQSAGYAAPKGLFAEIASALAMAAFGMTTFMAFIYAPTEKSMGPVQRIFYFHVPAAWAGFLAFLIVFGASIVCLVFLSGGRRELARRADGVAGAAAEVGVLFTSIVLITGPIWAKPVWFIWWTWDARLTSTLILWLIYVAYLMLRWQLLEGARGMGIAAVVGILGFVDVPIVYFAIRWWRTQHPQPVITMSGRPGSGLEAHMWHALLVALGAYLLVLAAFLAKRLGIVESRARIEELHRSLDA